MTIGKRVNIKTRWDKDLVPAGRSSQRNLLLEITAPPRPKMNGPRPPINLALVIDRSGSMGGSRIEAACKAATDIVSALSEQDRLSLVVFDSQVDTLVDGRAMDDIGKYEATRLIEKLQSRGTTNLGGGWYEGARCASRLLESARFTEGHVLVLSDGHANQGICDPDQLQRHASELAERGVKTSAVGIGANYSPLQLDALAEGGRGRLHDAETREDIVEVVLGELGELYAITARDVRLTIECPRNITLDLLTRSSIDCEGNIYSVQLGDIAADSSRPVAIRADVPACEMGENLPFIVTVEWRTKVEKSIPERERFETRLQVVPPHNADGQLADQNVVERVATLWEAVLAYRAMRRNERHDFAGATRLYKDSIDEYTDLVSSLPDASVRLDRVNRSTARVSRQWDGRSKRQSYTLSKKMMHAERDFRSRDQGDWHDHIDN